MKKDFDLSAVEPARREEITRRAAVLDEYIAIWRPSATQRKVFADRLDISPSHLGVLASIWRNTRNPAAIPGARSKNRHAPVHRINDKAVKIMEAAIEKAGPLARRKDVVSEVTEQCNLAGIATPSASTITNAMTLAKTKHTAPLSLEPEILIGDCLVRLPVTNAQLLTMPRMMVAVALPQRHILAVDICCNPRQTPSLSRLMEALESVTTSSGLNLQLRAPHASPIERATIGAISRDESLGRPAFSRIMGKSIAGVGIVHHVAKAKSPAALLRGRHAKPISVEQAERVILGAIEDHNRSMSPLPSNGVGILAKFSTESTR